jgi:hypothetical protein
MITTRAERRIAWLCLNETFEDAEVEARPDFLPETMPVLLGRAIAPDPILNLVEFVFRIAAEHAKAQPRGLPAQAVHQTQQTVRLLHGLATGKAYAFHCMFLACPQHFLDNGINLDIPAVKKMAGRVPTASTMKFTPLEEHHRA